MLNTREDRILRYDKNSFCLQAKRYLSQFTDINPFPKLKFPGRKDAAVFLTTLSLLIRRPPPFVASALIFCPYARLVLTMPCELVMVDAENYNTLPLTFYNMTKLKRKKNTETGISKLYVKRG